jgi:hypothetical protein
MRTSSVFSPLKIKKALSGESVAPVSALKPVPRICSISALDPTTAPPSRSPWPPRYFVAEWTELAPVPETG